jgi:hypothetical protein
MLVALMKNLLATQKNSTKLILGVLKVVGGL